MDWIRVSLFIFLIFMISLTVYTAYSNSVENRGWENDFQYVNFVAYSLEDFENGRDCPPVNCTDITTGTNSRILECTCESNNKSFRMVSTERIRKQVMKYPDYKQEWLDNQAVDNETFI